MIHLLKQKSKIGIAQKARKQFKAFKPGSSDDEQIPLHTSSSPSNHDGGSQPEIPSKKKIIPKVIEEYKFDKEHDWNH